MKKRYAFCGVSSRAVSMYMAPLAGRYRELQKIVHPDKFASGTDLEKRLSVQQSAFINEAYQTLKKPLSRAKYLLSLKGFDEKSNKQSAMAPEFLMQQMELRESLVGVKSSSDPVAGVMRLSDEVAQSIKTLMGDIAGMFAEEESFSGGAVHDRIQRLQFMIKLNEDIEFLEEELS